MKSISSNTNRWRGWGFSLADRTYTLVATLLLLIGLAASSAANMLPNPSAETGTDPNADWWVNSWGAAVAVTDASLAHTGNRVWACTAPDGTGTANFSSGGQVTPVAVGETFTFSTWVKAPNASATHQIKVRLRWGFYNPTGGWSSVSGGDYFYLKTADWTQITASTPITCPADATDGISPGRLVTRVYCYAAYRESDTGADIADAAFSNYPVYIDDISADSPDYSFATVSGTVTDGGVGVPGAIVKATETAGDNADFYQVVQSAPTGGSGNYSLVCRVSKEYQLSASSLPIGREVASAPAAFAPADTTPITGKNLLLGASVNPARFEAESAALVGCSIQADANASGGQRVAANVFGGNDTVTFTAVAPAAGLYPMAMGYYQPWDASRNTYLTVNGVARGTIASPQVIAPAYGTSSTVVPLNAGINTIVLGNGTDQWGPHWDYIDLGPAALPTFTVSGTVSGLPVGSTATVKAVGSLATLTATTALNGTYSMVVPDGDTYTVSASAFPLSAAAQTVTVSGANVTGINFALTDSTLVWYKFDGNFNDSSAWAKNGTLSGVAAVVPRGRVGGSCLSTVAGNGGVVVPMLGTASGDAPLLNQYTMSAWVRCTTSAEWQTLYATPTWTTGDVNNPVFSQSSQMLCSVNGTVGTDHWYPAAWGSTGQWHFMTVSYDSVTMTETFYFDGVKVRTDSFTTTVPVNFTEGASIGCWGSPGNRQFTGEIDDFRIFGAAANDADAAALYAAYPAMVTHTITATTDAGATLSPVGAVSVMHGYDQTFTISANLGYRVTSVLVDGVAQTLPVASYTFTNVTTTHTVAVASVLQPTHSVAGKVTDAAGVGISGASVYISGSPSASVAPLFTVTTAPDGTYSKTGVPEGTIYVSAGGVAGMWNSPDAILPLLADATGVNFSLKSNTRNIPAQSDLWFSGVTEALPASGLTGNWPSYLPTGLTFAAMNNPAVDIVGNQKWVKYSYTAGTGYRVVEANATSVACNGATIVAVVKPKRNIDSWWSSIVNFFYNSLDLRVRNTDGVVQVVINGITYDGPTLADGQEAVVSAVIQPDGTIKVAVNGVETALTAPVSSFTQITAGGTGSFGYGQDVNIGRNNPDGWSTYNGDIGDVFVYTTALSDTDRHTLESDLGAKFGIPIPTYAAVSGLVTDGGVPVEGVIVKATQTANPAKVSVSAPTAADGSYSLYCVVGQQYQLSATALPAGRAVTNAPAPFTAANTTPITGKNLLLGPDPDFDPDLLFSTRSSAYVTGAGWPTVTPIGRTLTRMGNPTTRTINGQQWVNNHAEGDGFTFTNVGWGPPPGTLAFNGGTIVATCRPIRYSPANAYQQLVSILLNQFSIDIRRSDGRLRIKRGGVESATFANIPNGQITTISAVVQPTGEYKIYTNGVLATNNMTTYAFTTLTPTVNYGTDVNVGKGWNADGWSSFNGDIGDTYVYQVAIDDAKRTALEASLMAKYGTATSYTITATAGVGGTITPSGAVAVPQQSDQTFTIATLYGYQLADVLVDLASVGPVATYTFSNVTAPHAISATWTELPNISGIVSGPSGPIYSAFVSLSTNPDGSSPVLTVTSDSLGGYRSVPPAASGTYYLIARKGGYVTSAVKTVVMTGSSLTGQDFTLVKSAGLDPIVVLDAATLTPGTLATWTNTGTLGGTFRSYDATSVPSVASSYGMQAVEFSQPTQDAAGRQTLVGSMTTPAQITGRSDWTISTKLYRTDASVTGENAYMCWAGRDNPAPNNTGSTAQFSYRNNTAYVHYGSDRGYTTVPSEGAWHTVTITYSNTVEKVFVDGILDSTATRTLNLKAAGMMMVGGANWRDVRVEDQYWRFNGAIASLKIYDQALTDAEVAAMDLPAFRWAGPNNGVWSDPANWNANIPGAGNLAVLSDSASAGATVQLDTAVTVKGVLFNNLVPNTTIASTNGSTLTLDDGTANASIVVNGGSHTIGVSLAAAVGVTVAGPGTVTLTADNSLGAGTAGGFRVNGSGKLAIAGGNTIVVDGTGGTINGNATLEVSGSGILRAGGRDTVIGDGTDNNGTISLKGSGSMTLRGGGVYTLGNGGGGTGTINIQDTATFTVDRDTGNLGGWSPGSLVLGMGWGPCTGVVNQVGGTVNLPFFQDWAVNNGPGLIMGGVVTGSPVLTTYNLDGGTLNVSAVFNVNMIEPGGTGTGWVLDPPGNAGQTALFNFNGGVLKATQSDSTDPLAVGEGTAHLMGNLSHAYVKDGGARIDTSGFDCSVNQPLEHGPTAAAVDGGLSKLGGGTLTLLQAATYTGPTKVQAGVLGCAAATSLAAGNLEIEASATVNLGYSGTRTISSLKIAGSYKGPGVYGSTTAGITGTGTVTVGAPGLPLSGFTRPGGVPTFSIEKTAIGSTYRLVYKNNLTDSSWTPIGAGIAGNNGTIALSDTSTPPLPKERFYRLEVR